LTSLEHANLLRRATTMGSVLSHRVLFTTVRDPFARAVSIYKYLVENSKLSSSPYNVNFCKTFAGKDLDLLKEGSTSPHTAVESLTRSRASSTHWTPQSPPLIAACHYGRVLTLPVEDDVPTAIDKTVVRRVNEDLNLLEPHVHAANDHASVRGAHRHDLPRLKAANARNRRGGPTHNANRGKYSCPWQCYYALCGERCVDAVNSHYALDMLLLGYPSVRSVADLFVAAPSHSDEPPFNPAKLCQARCSEAVVRKASGCAAFEPEAEYVSSFTRYAASRVYG